MFFSPVVVLVEGIEDYAYITSCLMLSGLFEEYRRLGCHIVPANRKSHMVQPRAVAKILGIPTFTVFDSDGNERKNSNREMHRRDNLALLRLCEADMAEPFPKEHYWGKNVVVWSSDMGEVVRAEMGDAWMELRNDVAADYGHEGGLEKNARFIGDLLSAGWERGIRPESLMRLCNQILSFARSSGVT
jgi:hypothetical protein